MWSGDGKWFFNMLKISASKPLQQLKGHKHAKLKCKGSQAFVAMTYTVGWVSFSGYYFFNLQLMSCAGLL